MLKKIAAFMVLLTMVFAFQSTAWAAAIQAEDSHRATVDQIIRLEANPQIAMLNSNLDIFPGSGMGGMKVQPWFWLLSIPVPGLGQLMMNNVPKALMFFLAVVAIGISSQVVPGLLSGTAGLGGTVATVLYVVGALVWLWNIWDAYTMSFRHTGMSSAEIEEKAAQRLEEQLKALAQFVETNKLVFQQNGATFEHRLSTF